MRLVCEERTELTAIVQSQQRDIAVLQQSDANNKVNLPTELITFSEANTF